MRFLEVMENAKLGISYLERGQVGCGPMTERMENKKKGKELILPFLRARFPKRYEEEARKLLDRITDLV